MAYLRWGMDLKTSRFRRLPGRAEKKLSAALIQDADVEVKWNT
jgi:hypothetical protein